MNMGINVYSVHKLSINLNDSKKINIKKVHLNLGKNPYAMYKMLAEKSWKCLKTHFVYIILCNQFIERKL